MSAGRSTPSRPIVGRPRTARRHRGRRADRVRERRRRARAGCAPRRSSSGRSRRGPRSARARRRRGRSTSRLAEAVRAVGHARAGHRVGHERHAARCRVPDQAHGLRGQVHAVVDDLHDHVVARQRRSGDPGSRCSNGRIALKRCVTVRTPLSNAAFACSEVASEWPQETVTPRACSAVDQRVGAGQLGRERHDPHRPGREQALEQAEVGVAPRRRRMRAEPALGEERAFEVDAEDSRAPRRRSGSPSMAATSSSSGVVISVGR